MRLDGRAGGAPSIASVSPFEPFDPAGRTDPRPPDSTPTPRSASAARPARWPASSGISSRPTACDGRATATTIPRPSRPPRGGTSSSSSSSRRAGSRSARVRRFRVGRSGGHPGVAARRDRRRSMADDERRLQALRRRPCQHACPTGAIIYNEFSNVYIQPDICNGCAYCIAACPFGVITRSQFDGHAHKCTLCYDRQRDGLVPACAKACPTARSSSARSTSCASGRGSEWTSLHAQGSSRGAYLYGDRPHRDLFRAEFVLPPGRSSLDLWPARAAVQPVAAHGGRLRAGPSVRRWSRSPRSSWSGFRDTLRCRCGTRTVGESAPVCGPAGDQGTQLAHARRPRTCSSTT